MITVSALTGHVCHEAVKANKESFVTVQTTDNREYYFGDDLNYYLLEGPFSILCFVKGFYDAKLRSNSSPDVNLLVQKVTAKIGDAQYRIWNQEEPELLFNNSLESALLLSKMDDKSIAFQNDGRTICAL